MKRKEKLVLWVLQKVRDGSVQQQRWWRKILCAFLMILPFDDVLVNFNR